MTDLDNMTAVLKLAAATVRKIEPDDDEDPGLYPALAGAFDATADLLTDGPASSESNVADIVLHLVTLATILVEASIVEDQPAGGGS